MRAIPPVSIALVVCVSLLADSGQGRPAETQEAARPRGVPRRFSERPPVQFEFEPAAERGPRIIVTNLHQEPLTAFVVQTEPKSEQELPQTLAWDAFDRGWSPIPRGLSVVESVPHIAGGPTPNAKLVAAVWDDGSTYGSDEMIQRIYANRSTLAEAFDRALRFLQTGLDQQWTRDQFLAAADRDMKSEGGQVALSPDAKRAAMIPAMLIKTNLQGTTGVDGKAAPLEFAVRKLIEVCRQRRDSLTPLKTN